jgi:N-glycosylase/DNA lyase
MRAWVDGVKITAAAVPIVGGIAGAMIWMLTVFETVDASEEKWAAHNKALVCRTVYDLEKDIQRYMERLRFDRTMTEADRQWLREQVAALEKKIKRLDSGGEC